ncbi:MAG: BT_3044 domain-containing protein [Draconibacterium sp.]
MKQRILVITVLMGVLVSCNDDAIFEKEMYKNEVALISSDYYNTFQEVIQLSNEEVVIGYIAASVGGTDAPTKELVIGLEEDTEPLALYNYSLYDADSALYAKPLPKAKYEIPDPKITVDAGERAGKTMIRLRPDGLSPDSTYFISLKATDISGVELNPKKSTILYQVVLENEYASQAKNSLYTMTGMVDGMVTAANKELFPLSYNSVRLIAGNETFVSTEAAIKKSSIVLEVAEDNSVTIKPYGTIQVTQLDDDDKYPNVFMVDDYYGQKTNVFLLSYEYTIGNVTKVMKERVEMQVRN